MTSLFCWVDIAFPDAPSPGVGHGWRKQEEDGRQGSKVPDGFFWFFLKINYHFYFQAQLVEGFTLSGLFFWTNLGHKCRPFFPPVRAFVLSRA